MRGNKRMRAYRGWRAIVGGVLVLSALVLPDGRAAFRFNRDSTQPHHRSKNTTTPSAAPKATPPAAPKISSSFDPDNDFLYAPANAPAERGLLIPSPPGVPPFSAAALPWNQPGFVDYNEPPRAPRDSSIAEAKKYSLEITPLPQGALAAPLETAVLIAHLPEQATLWVEGAQTRTAGRTRYFQSPPLLPGRKYSYRVRALWLENGQMVSQTRTIPVQAGRMQALYLRPLLPPSPRR